MVYKMQVRKFLIRYMYGFLESEELPEVFFHLGVFHPLDCSADPVPPLPGEWVDVEVDLDKASENRAPRATKVQRLTPPARLAGVVENFNHKAGYGFVRSGGESFFLHKSEIRDGKTPVVGDSVNFFVGKKSGNSRACYVSILR